MMSRVVGDGSTHHSQPIVPVQPCSLHCCSQARAPLRTPSRRTPSRTRCCPPDPIPGWSARAATTTTCTRWAIVSPSEARDIADLKSAERKTVWTPPASGPNAISIWAPELHRIDGKWYIYYTAAASGHDDDAHRGVFVLENSSADPLRGEWLDRGQLNTAHSGIDGTTFAIATDAISSIRRT